MSLDKHYEQRKEDVDAYYRCLDFVNGVESHKGKPIVDSVGGRELMVDLQMQCCMKANTLVILYNMVESTICECLNNIYDAVADDGLTYAELTDEMRHMWTNSLKRARKPEGTLDEVGKMALKVVFETLAINTSGSIDIRKIFETFEKHGCMIPDEKRDECADSFLTVKTKRNLLAHGNVSFSQCGANYLMSELERMKNDILDFLPVVIDATKKFVKDKKYKR